MNVDWKRTYDALTQLRREVNEGRDPGTRHMTAERKMSIINAIDVVRNDTGSCKLLGEILARNS